MDQDIKWPIKNLCIFCGSSSPKDQIYADSAVSLTKEMLARGIGLVYGGGTHGMMGIVGKSVSEGGGNVVGIIPSALKAREQLDAVHYGDQICVDSMHERKFMMYQKSDAFVALAGGFGTLDELLEVLTWAQIGIHQRPVGLLNVGGFFNGLLDFIKNAVESGFISKEAEKLLIVSDDPADLLNKMSQHVPSPSVFQWPVKP
jgi:hypothetical protein